jgi:hypothetical protein
MRRTRDVVMAAALGLGLVVIPRVGVLTAGAAGELPEIAFFDRMRELGYVEGKTVVFDRRFAAGKIEQLSTLARQILAGNPDVIFAR